MKAKFLLLSALFMSAGFTATAADEDVTPNIVKFDQQEVGQYDFFSASVQGSNPTAPYPETSTNGLAVLSGGQVNPSTYTGINKGIHIVDSEFGKMLLLKGNGSAERPDLQEANLLNGWWNMHIWTSPDFPVNTPVRFHCCMKIVGDPVPANCKISITPYGGTDANAPIPSTTNVFVYTPWDTKWWPVYRDLDMTLITDGDKVPLRMKFEMGNSMAGRAFYIYKIQFTANPSTECPSFDLMFDGWDYPDGSEGPSGVENVAADAQGFITWGGGTIYLNDMAIGSNVNIYSISGALVKSVKVTDAFMEVPVESGIYIVENSGKTTKVIL